MPPAPAERRTGGRLPTKRISSSGREREAHEGFVRFAGLEDAAREVRVIRRVREILGLEANRVPPWVGRLQMIGAVHLKAGQVGSHLHAYATRGGVQLARNARAFVDGPAVIETTGERDLRMRGGWRHAHALGFTEIERRARHGRD